MARDLTQIFQLVSEYADLEDTSIAARAGISTAADAALAAANKRASDDAAALAQFQADQEAAQTAFDAAVATATGKKQVVNDAGTQAVAAANDARAAAETAAQAAQKAVSDKFAEITDALKKLDTPVEVAPPG